MTTQPHPEPSEEATFPPFPQNAIMSADAWRWSTERDSIWLHRVVVGQSQLNAMRVERDAARLDAQELRAIASARGSEIMALKTVDVDALKSAAQIALDVLDHYQHGGSEFRKPAVRAIAALRASLASTEWSPR